MLPVPTVRLYSGRDEQILFLSAPADKSRVVTYTDYQTSLSDVRVIVAPSVRRLPDRVARELCAAPSVESQDNSAIIAEYLAAARRAARNNDNRKRGAIAFRTRVRIGGVVYVDEYARGRTARGASACGVRTTL